MPIDPHDNTRREFLSKTGRLAALAGGAAAATPLVAEQPAVRTQAVPRRRGKQIIAGSPSRSYSRAVRLDRTVYVSGCVGVDGKGILQDDFATQARQTLLNLQASVERSGSSLSRVLKCTCFLKRLEHFATFNEIYVKFFPNDPPARSTVIVKDLVVPGALLEVDCVCYVDA